ncbi:MAG: hypothetical protein MUF57_08045, partial [Gammaproteobacteria bacterium]|nr:hypothetical protein [Gammaproteobacteria bacterium]
MKVLPHRSHLTRALAVLGAACLLLAAPLVAQEPYRVEQAQGRIERASGPADLLPLVREGKVTVRALIGWGRLPPDLTAVLVAERANGVDLLGADAEALAAHAAKVREGAAAATLTRLAELLRRHDFLDWVPLAGGTVEAGDVLRAGPGATARLVSSHGAGIDVPSDRVVLVPAPAQAPTVAKSAPPQATPAGLTAAGPTAQSQTAECAAGLAALDAPPAPLQDRPWVGHLGDLHIDLPAGWLPIREPDRQVLAGYAIGDMDQKNGATLGLAVAPAPEAEMVKEIAKGTKAEVQGPTAMSIGGKAANHYRATIAEDGQPGWLALHFFQEPRSDGTRLVVVAGGAGEVGRDAEPVIRKILEGARAAELPYRLIRRVGGPG